MTGDEERKRVSGVWYVEPTCSMIASVILFSRGISVMVVYLVMGVCSSCNGCVFSSGSL